MRLQNGSIYGSRLDRRLRKLAKSTYHSATRFGRQRESLLFIVGCQRSGTALLSRTLERDFNTSVYKEVSKLSSEDEPKQLRLNPMPVVRATLDSNKAPFIVLKPLVESQNVIELLDTFEGAKAVWMYRGYRDVVDSFLRKWGPRHSIDDLRPIVTNQQDNWRTEKVSKEARRFVARFFSEEMEPADASAIYWYLRNRLFLDLDLKADRRIALCRYEALVINPALQVRRIYEHMSRPYPGDKILKEVTARRVGSGNEIHISPGIDEACRQLFDELRALEEPPTG